MKAAARQSLRAPTRGSTGAEHTSAPSRRCSFLQEAAQKVSEQLPLLATELMSTAQIVARESNLPRRVFKGVSCCVACEYPSEKTHQTATACNLCEYLPRKRTRGDGGSRSTKATRIKETAAQIPTARADEPGERRERVPETWLTVAVTLDERDGERRRGEGVEEENNIGTLTALPVEHHTSSLSRKKKRKKRSWCRTASE